jgi:hypothetical protein
MSSRAMLQIGAVRAERYCIDVAVMGDVGTLAAVRYRHQPRCPVRARGGEILAIRAERHRQDRAIVGDAGAAAVRHRH